MTEITTTRHNSRLVARANTLSAISFAILLVGLIAVTSHDGNSASGDTGFNSLSNILALGIAMSGLVFAVTIFRLAIMAGIPRALQLLMAISLGSLAMCFLSVLFRTETFAGLALIIWYVTASATTGWLASLAGRKKSLVVLISLLVLMCPPVAFITISFYLRAIIAASKSNDSKSVGVPLLT